MTCKLTAVQVTMLRNIFRCKYELRRSELRDIRDKHIVKLIDAREDQVKFYQDAIRAIDNELRITSTFFETLLAEVK
jgi:hypothetical protein